MLQQAKEREPGSPAETQTASARARKVANTSSASCAAWAAASADDDDGGDGGGGSLGILRWRVAFFQGVVVVKLAASTVRAWRCASWAVISAHFLCTHTQHGQPCARSHETRGMGGEEAHCLMAAVLRLRRSI